MLGVGLSWICLIAGLVYTQLSVIGKGGEGEERVAFGSGCTLGKALLCLG